MENYSESKENVGVIAEAGRDERYVPLLDQEVHFDNQVKCHNEWKHKVEETRVLVVTIEQGGNLNTNSPNINEVIVVGNQGPQKIESGFTRKNNSDLMSQLTKEDAIEAAKEWMNNNPDGRV